MTVSASKTRLNKPRSNSPPSLWPGTKKEAARLEIERQKALKAGLFSSFTLTKDPNALQFMQYNEVVYPKMSRKVLPHFRPAELASLWLSGFVDHEQRSKKRGSEATVGSDTTNSNVILESGSVTQEDDLADDHDIQPSIRKRIPSIHSTGMALKLSRLAYRPSRRKGGIIHNKKKVITKLDGQALPVEFKSSDLEKYYGICRTEQEAAFRIQRAIRRFLVWKRWHRDWNRYQAAKTIQALIRGVITRRLIALWQVKFGKVVTQWQARIRRHLSNKRLKVQRGHEELAAIKIQALARMHLGRRRRRDRQRHLAAVCIQRLWRGIVGRAASDRLWLDQMALTIQRSTRRFLASRYYTKLRQAKLAAATKIQRAFRGFLSARIRNGYLKGRELDDRRYNIQVLSSDEVYMQSKMNLILKRMAQTRICERSLEASKRLNELLHKVDETENDYMGFHRKRRSMSPRDFTAGWDKQYAASIQEYRLKITQLKLEVILDASFQSRRLQEEIIGKDALLSETQLKIQSLGRWREEENNEILEDEKRRRFDDEAADMKRKVAEQKRKWRIKFHAHTGKPDKRRPSGRPWDPSIMARPERDVFSGGAVDLFAFDMNGSKSKPGSDGSIKAAVGKLMLQSALMDIQKGEQVMQPIFKIFEGKVPGQAASLPTGPPDNPSPNVPSADQALMLVPIEVTKTSAPASLGAIKALKRKDVDDDEEEEGLMSTGRISALPSQPLSSSAERLVSTQINDDPVESIQPLVVEGGDLNSSTVPEEDVEKGEDYEEEEENERYLSSVASPLSLDSRVNEDYHILKTAHLRTALDLWPLKEAEARIQESYEEVAVKARILAKYEGKVSRNFRPPVTRVPWHLIDELEGERLKWEAEKNAFDKHVYQRIVQNRSNNSSRRIKKDL